MTRLQVLNETISYFWGNNGRFCAIDGKCQYVATISSDGCAIGRLLHPELAEALPQNKGINDISVFEMMPTQLKALGIDFLRALQDCHDSKYLTHKDKDCIIESFAKLVDTNQIIFPN